MYKLHLPWEQSSVTSTWEGRGYKMAACAGQVAQEMLFVWPESGAMAALEAANKEPVMSPHMTRQVRAQADLKHCVCWVVP